MTACASGCSIHGEHLPGCNGTVLNRVGDSVECRGCLPRPAEFGRLCGWCWGRLQSAVHALPSLVECLCEAAEPTAPRPMGAGRPGRARRVGGYGLYPAALVQADELHAVLATWCEEVTAERPTAPPPRSATRWTDPVPAGAEAGSRRAPASTGREAIGPAGPGSTRMLVRWLDAHLEWAAEQPWAGDMLADLVCGEQTARRRFPMERPERRIEGARCPRCRCLSLVEVPPPTVGARAPVRCTLPACGLVMGESEWAAAGARAGLRGREGAAS